jgi:CubicO group peptidase (beta-lactamase class C family)
MSKSFTAMSIMQLVEKGKLELDAPVQRYLRWFRVVSSKDSSRITIRHLLNHTSGISKFAPRASGSNASLEAHARVLRGVQLKNAPGVRHEYSSPNYQVLGHLVEVSSGQEFGEYEKENVLIPLAMDDSFVSLMESERAGMAAGHRYLVGRLAAGVPYQPGRLPTASLFRVPATWGTTSSLN